MIFPLFRRGLIVLTSLLAGSAATLAPAATPGLDAKVRALFDQHCLDCHGKNEDQAPVLDSSVSLASLRGDSKVIVPGNPAASKLFELVSLAPDAKKRMPKNTAGDPRPPLSAEEKATLAEWIRGDDTQPNRLHLTEAEVMRAILADLQQLPAADRPWQRYVSLHNLHNQPTRLVSARDLDTHRAGLSKLINSLSWQPAIVSPKAIDPARVVYRLDLRRYGWDASMWALVARHNPYGFVNAELDAQLAAASGTSDLLWLRADWFVFACAQPPLYEQLLYPAKLVPRLLAEPARAEQHLEAALGVKPLENLRAAAKKGNSSAEAMLFGQTAAAPTAENGVLRAGFNESGVSNFANRLIERHGLASGRAYWKSYDFANSQPGTKGSLLSHPLGPVGSGLSAGDRFAFKHDGGEFIFHLPNGLQGYLLTTDTGKLLARAPDRIVQDLSRLDRQILNGISCIKCHSDGMKDPPRGLRDDIRAGAKATLAGLTTPDDLRTLENLYASEADLARIVEADRAIFRRALHAAGADDSAQEPVSFVYNFFLRNISEETLAVELDFDRTKFAKPLIEVFAASNDPEILTLAALVPGGLRREEFIPRLSLITTHLFTKQMRPFTPLAFAEFDRGGGAPSPVSPPVQKANAPVATNPAGTPFKNPYPTDVVPAAPKKAPPPTVVAPPPAPSWSDRVKAAFAGKKWVVKSGTNKGKGREISFVFDRQLEGTVFYTSKNTSGTIATEYAVTGSGRLDEAQHTLVIEWFAVNREATSISGPSSGHALTSNSDTLTSHRSTTFTVDLENKRLSSPSGNIYVELDFGSPVTWGLASP
jgi:mono/diheme cytochrome c family protein